MPHPLLPHLIVQKKTMRNPSYTTLEGKTGSVALLLMAHPSHSGTRPFGAIHREAAVARAQRYNYRSSMHVSQPPRTPSLMQEFFMHFVRKWFAFCLISLALPAFAQEAREGRLLRFPDIYKDKVAFVYGGDIWLASTSGG